MGRMVILPTDSTFCTIMVMVVAKVGRKIEFIAARKVVFPDVLSGGSQSGFSVVTQYYCLKQAFGSMLQDLCPSYSV